MQIICPKCGTLLRRLAGMHYAGEPLARVTGDAIVIACPQCGFEYREEDDAVDNDGADPSASPA
jgi:RNase P subunit RPR2